jgi:hypothetical protein
LLQFGVPFFGWGHTNGCGGEWLSYTRPQKYSGYFVDGSAFYPILKGTSRAFQDPMTHWIKILFGVFGIYFSTGT